MSCTDIITINCLLAGRGPSQIFSVHIASNTNISDLKNKIKEALPITLLAIDPKLFKVSLTPEELNPTLDPHDIEGAEELSSPLDEVPNVFNDLPRGRVHVIVLPPSSSLPPATSAGDALNSVGLNQYEPIFINVAAWGADKHHFTDVDISLNTIEEEEGPESSPTFVKDYLANLDKKAGLPPEARKRFDAMDPAWRTTYFVITDGLGTQGRDAKLQEVLHIDSLTSMPWQSMWQRSISPLTEPLANAMYFSPFILTCINNPQSEVTATLYVWLSFLAFTPKLKLALTEALPIGLSRLLQGKFWPLGAQNSAQVHSTPSSTDPWPHELVRMLLCGASVVRFANGFIDPFKQQKNFVLAAIYIGQTGIVQWHTLYQNSNQTKVYYRTEQFNFNEPIQRVKFALWLYNFYFAVGGGSDAHSGIAAYNYEVHSHRPKLSSFHTGQGLKRAATDSDEGDARARARPRGDAATELDELEAHGYTVEPDRIETEHGTFEALRKLPPNLLTVFRRSDPSAMLVAKKIREGSDELEILRLIHRMRPPSDHIIALRDSFHGQRASWVVLPKITNNVEDWLWYDPKRFAPHFAPVCWGLIAGLAYLHKHHIAHRDIKPENLLVDHTFCLKIIDFDVAVQVRDADEEVDDHCGTEGWVAPEIEMRVPRYSPIKADRWACGAVIVYILGRVRRTDAVLEAIAKKLKVDAPGKRPSLVEWWPRWSQHQPAPVVRVGVGGTEEGMVTEL
ncbi:hypothetical protein EYR40_010410 [Pleurotus pulmonarius]|nr:hypothetical protein EYR36_010198 [Pleurotus pulmonarius]KAF4588855.1 hypothetical protein EYR40_010410 [Pleurotus pulmonarius]